MGFNAAAAKLAVPAATRPEVVFVREVAVGAKLAAPAAPPVEAEILGIKVTPLFVPKSGFGEVALIEFRWRSISRVIVFALATLTGFVVVSLGVGAGVGRTVGVARGGGGVARTGSGVARTGAGVGMGVATGVGTADGEGNGVAIGVGTA